MRVIDKLSYSQNWNIGFCEQSIVHFFSRKKLNKIRWMKHPYRDRWFADPFIVSVTENEILVFVEECLIDKPRGTISELIIDKKTMRLMHRNKLLELKTHLSYPAIYRQDNKLYVCPENGQSGKLTLYEYDTLNHKLINPVVILNEAVADATIIKHESNYFLIATKYPDTQNNSFLYKSESLFGPYLQIQDAPVCSSLECSRPGGSFILLKDSLFRPSQNCVKRYGAALSVMRIDNIGNTFSEQLVFTLKPESFKYNLGLHTINYCDGYIVIDGYGYSYPVIGRIIRRLRFLKRKLFNSNR